MEKAKEIRVAILDLYDGVENQGMRCIRDILRHYSREHDTDLSWDEFDVRQQGQVPDLDYDLYISSGGPGSPLDSEGSDWENAYFDWLKKVEAYNADPAQINKK